MELPFDRREDDNQLLFRIQSRDERALEALYDRYGGLLFALLLRMLGEREMAEEVLQDVFLTVWRASSVWDHQRGSVQAWLVAIARNRAIDQLRKRRAPSVPLTFDLPSTDERPDEVAVERAISAEVKESVSSLPDMYREVLEAVYFSGLTQKEAAQALEIPYGTVKSRLRLAFERMARALRARGLTR